MSGLVSTDFTQDSAADADFLLNLTNDGWFGESAQQFQHAAHSVFRAVENRRPVIRCTNNGLTCYVDEAGFLHDLGVGAAADITVYTEQDDKEAMFTTPDYVFKDGELIVKNGEVVKIVWGNVHTVKPDFDREAIESRLKPYFDRYLTMKMDNFIIRDWEIEDGGRSKILVHPCRGQA